MAVAEVGELHALVAKSDGPAIEAGGHGAIVVERNWPGTGEHGDDEMGTELTRVVEFVVEVRRGHMGGGNVEAGIRDCLAQGCSGLGEDERVEFDLSEPDLAERLKKGRKVHFRFFSDGVELDSIEELRCGRRKSCIKLNRTTGGSGQGG